MLWLGEELAVTTQSVTIRLPDPICQQLKRRADRTHRPLEDELLEVVATAVPVADEIPKDLAGAISRHAAITDEDIWQVARYRLRADAAERLEVLGQKRQREALTEAEAQEAAILSRQQECVMLVRACTAALLKLRGYDVSSLLIDACAGAA
jgi:plasmid stability protein